MPRRLADLSQHVLRGTALALTLLAAGTVAVDAVCPEWFTALDQALEQRYIGPAHRELAAAATGLAADPARSAGQLEQLRAANAGHQFGDRREQVWAVATSLLAQIELQRDPTRAVQLAVELTRRRPQDLPSRLLHADALRLSGAIEPADLALAELHALVPEHEDLTRRIVTAAAALQQWLAAGQALAAHLQRPPALRLEVRYATAAPDPRAQPMQRAYLLARLDARGRLAASFRLPAGATEVEIALPARACLELLQPRLLPPDDGRRDGPGDAPPVAVGTGIRGGPDRFAIAGGSDPALAPGLRFPLRAALAEPLDLRFLTTILVAPPAFAVPLLQPAPAAAMVDALLQAHALAAAAAIDRQRRWLAIRSEPVRSQGPGGVREHPGVAAGGWPDPQGILAAVTCELDVEATELLVPWPRPRGTAADVWPRLELEPPADPPPQLARAGDALRLRFDGPRQLTRIRVEGRLQ